MNTFSTDFQTLVKYFKFPCIFFMNYWWVWETGIWNKFRLDSVAVCGIIVTFPELTNCWGNYAYAAKKSNLPLLERNPCRRYLIATTQRLRILLAVQVCTILKHSIYKSLPITFPKVFAVSCLANNALYCNVNCEIVRDQNEGHGPKDNPVKIAVAMTTRLAVLTTQVLHMSWLQHFTTQLHPSSLHSSSEQPSAWSHCLTNSVICTRLSFCSFHLVIFFSVHTLVSSGHITPLTWSLQLSHDLLE